MISVKNIKDYLSMKIGCRIIVIYYGSRNRKSKYIGILSNLYANIFTVRLANGDIKSFSYIDIITKTIRICI